MSATSATSAVADAGSPFGSQAPAGRAPLLQAEGLGKRFGTLQALGDVSFTLAAGEIHCLLGENGAGKSTLCNLIFGVHQPSEGRMRLEGRAYRPTRPADALAAGIAMVHQHFSLVGDATVVDNLLLGQSRGVLKRAECAQRVRALSDRYGLALDPAARIADLSVGERQRVEIVKCLMREPRLLVLDEPTAVLLPDEIDALLGVCQRVAAQGCGVVLVTHKLAEIRKVAARVTVLRGGRVVARSDHPADEIDALVRAMIQRDLEPAEAGSAVIASGAQPDGSTVPAVMGASDGLSVFVSEPASATASATAPAAADRVEPAGSAPSRDALTIDGVSVRDAQGVVRVDQFTCIVKEGEIVGVAGVEGNGQVELVGALSGLMSCASGRFHVGAQELTDRAPALITAAGVGVVPEDRHATGCVTAMSLAENLFLNRLGRFVRYGMLDRAALRREARQQMARYDVRAASPDVPFSALSGGNQQKAVLARELTTDGLKVLIAAQPTRGLDVGAVEAVYGHIKAAARQGVGVLLISSELDDLLTVAHRIVVIYRGRVMGECAADASQRTRIGAWMAGHAA